MAAIRQANPVPFSYCAHDRAYHACPKRVSSDFKVALACGRDHDAVRTVADYPGTAYGPPGRVLKRERSGV